MNIYFIIILSKLLFFIIFINFNLNLISNFKKFFCYISKKYEIIKLENYLKFCNNYKLVKKFKKIINPKISIISPIFNREKFILRFLRSIQYQNFYNIEIILVDDFSLDNSVEIIKQYQKLDERIILIKNKKNKGTFITRNIGALYAKGKYIIIPDPDDIISQNILHICYNYAERYKYELIRFNIYNGKNKPFFYDKNKLVNKQINQPEISTLIFYIDNEFNMNDYFIYNKFIKKDVYIKAMNNIGDNYLNLYMTMNEDQVINYILHRTAKSFYYIKKIGYRYIINKSSITNTLIKKSSKYIYFRFIYIYFIFELSKNIKYEKDIINYLLNKLYNNVFQFNNKILSFNTNYYTFYLKLINKYLNCIFITKENNYFLNALKNLIEKYINILCCHNPFYSIHKIYYKF